MKLHAFDPVIAQPKPEFQRTKTSPERNLPVAIIDHRAGFRSLVSQILQQDTQGLNQRLAISHVKTIAIKIGEHPFVRVEAVAVGKLQTIVQIADFRAERGSSGHSSVNMQPRIVFPADLPNRRDWSNAVRRSGADSGADEKWGKPGFPVIFYRTRQTLRFNRELLIDFNKPQIFPSDSGDLNRFLDR